jgi:formylglycine-generating enzyme required for sulfatase activity
MVLSRQLTRGDMLMAERQDTPSRGSVVDITELAVLGEQFPLRLMQLGFRLMQVIDKIRCDQFRYVLPPVCVVPAGPFIRGNAQQTVELAAFQIGTYPVTVMEYACAVDAGAIPAPKGIGDYTWRLQQQRPDHPVVYIQWFDALAYAAWLSTVTRQPWRLLIEDEWEKAARGTDGRLYPWGDELGWIYSEHFEELVVTRANTIESGIGMTTPVGAYTDHGDASPYGVHDLAGNVSEWTRTLYQAWGRSSEVRIPDRPENDTDLRAKRVLRGGSWDDRIEGSRVAVRGGFPPDVAHPFLGMRLALSATPPLG